MAQRMPLPLTVSCFNKIQIGLSFLIGLPAHPGSPGKRAVKRVCVVCVRVRIVCSLVCMRPVHRSISCLIPSHASVKEMSEGGKCPLSGGQCPFPGILVLSTEIVDGRPRVLHLRRSSPSWMNAHCTKFILHWSL